jgi:hypothetical protein
MSAKQAADNGEGFKPQYAAAWRTKRVRVGCHVEEKK